MLYIVNYLGFGPTPPDSADQPPVRVAIHDYPGFLNALDSAATKAIAERDGVDPHKIRLIGWVSGTYYGPGIIENLLRVHRPWFESEAADAPGGVGYTWFECGRFRAFDLTQAPEA